MHNNIGKTFYWGTPLEKLVFGLKGAILFGDEQMAYNITRELYRGFMRINPNFWTE